MKMKKAHVLGAAALAAAALLGMTALVGGGGVQHLLRGRHLDDLSVVQCVQIQFEDGKTVDVSLKAELADKMTVRDLYEQAYQVYLEGNDNLTILDYQNAAAK